MGIMEILFIVALLTLSIIFPVAMGRLAIVGGLVILGLFMILLGSCFTIISIWMTYGIILIALGVMCILGGFAVDNAFESSERKRTKRNSTTCKVCGTVIPNGYLCCPKCGKELNK